MPGAEPTAPAAVRDPLLRRTWAQVLALTLLAAVAVSVPVLAAERDLAADLAGPLHWLSTALSALTIPVLACLIVASALHYLAAAASARAAAGVPMPLGELVAAQLAAAAANRLTPAGLGGAAVIGRFFTRRGRLQPVEAGAAVSALAVLGGVADVLAFAGLIGAGTALRVPGARGEVPLLMRRLAGLLPVPAGSWRWVTAGCAALVLTLAVVPPLRRRVITARLTAAARQYRRSLAALIRRPGRLSGLIGASAATTLLLAAGFAAAATLGGGLPTSSFAPLMIGYMVAAAAGNALPTPGGIGAAEAALAGVLLTAGLSGAAAVATVLAFRVVTFWTPAVLGAFVARPLRRRGAL